MRPETAAERDKTEIDELKFGQVIFSHGKTIIEGEISMAQIIISRESRNQQAEYVAINGTHEFRGATGEIALAKCEISLTASLTDKHIASAAPRPNLQLRLKFSARLARCEQFLPDEEKVFFRHRLLSLPDNAAAVLRQLSGPKAEAARRDLAQFAKNEFPKLENPTAQETMAATAIASLRSVQRNSGSGDKCRI